MTRLSMWIGVGVVGAGVSAAAIAGAGAAGADPGPPGGSHSSTSKSSSQHRPVKNAEAKSRPKTGIATTTAVPTSVKASAPRVQRRIDDTAAPSPVGLLAGIAFGALSALEHVVNGPPTVPPGSAVTVQTSSLHVTDSMTVEANWYFPDGDEPPQRMIVLQHGFLAIGPMYSYTAAWLAQDTNSIVVTPTLTSNFLADGGNGVAGSGLWLGGEAMGTVFAELFVGDRAALTASALDAGYAAQYGLDPQEAVLPEKFALAGHSAGGAMVSNVAGALVENGAADDLVGVIMLDGVPTGDQLPNALQKLAEYEEATGRYIPFRDIAAEPNVFNTAGNGIESLTAARPDHFDGVVLDGGVHMDSMQGGNPLIQYPAYLIAGLPLQQNQAAVRVLMADWFDNWFDGCADGGLGCPDPTGSTVAIDTPDGQATGAVIGSPADVADRLLSA